MQISWKEQTWQCDSTICVIGECRLPVDACQLAGRKGKKITNEIMSEHLLSKSILVENVPFESLINYALLFLKIQHCFIMAIILNFFTYCISILYDQT